jgi:hypothetical protein
MPGKAVPEGKHGLPNVCFSPNLVNCKQDFGGWIPRSFFFTTSECGDVGSCFFCAASRLLLLLPPSGSLLSSSLFQLSLSTDSISIDFSMQLVFITFVSVNFSLYHFFLHSSLSTSLSLYQFVFSAFVSINFSLSPCSLSTSLYHIHLYELFSTTFISINFSLSTCPLARCALALPASRLASWALGALATAAVSRGKRAASCFCV